MTIASTAAGIVTAVSSEGAAVTIGSVAAAIVTGAPLDPGRRAAHFPLTDRR